MLQKQLRTVLSQQEGLFTQTGTIPITVKDTIKVQHRVNSDQWQIYIGKFWTPPRSKFIPYLKILDPPLVTVLLWIERV